MDRMLQLLRWLCGWSPVLNIPKEDCVAVCGHTSYWDAFIIFFYLQDANVVILTKPQLFTWWSSPILRYLGYIPGPKLEDRGSGGVEQIIKSIQSAKKRPGLPTIFIISPKGTIENRPWRSGYKHIADGLGWPVVPMVIDYSRRIVFFRNENGTEELLKEALSLGCPRVPERSEIPIKITYDPFELLAVVDIVSFSNLTMLPGIIKLFWNGEFLIGALSTYTFYISWLYHRSNESSYAMLDSFLAKCLCTIALVRFYKNITYHFIGTLFLTVWLYYAGTPRDPANSFRGPYVVYHSLFHCVLSYAAYQLV